MKSILQTTNDSATVTVTDVLPTITITNNASPTSTSEPGGLITFTVQVNNTGTVESVDLTTLIDDVHGNLNGQGDCALPQSIATSSFYQCSFTATVNGNPGDSEINTVTATAVDDEANSTNDNDSATVTVTDVLPTITVTNNASPTSTSEPGGLITFTVQVNNTGTVESVDLTTLIDDIHGNLNGQGDCVYYRNRLPQVASISVALLQLSMATLVILRPIP